MGSAFPIIFTLSLIIFLQVSGISGKLELVYQWKQMEFENISPTNNEGFDGIVFPGDMPSRNYASSSSTRGNGSETFNAYNNVPMGAMYHQGFLFITIPRRRSGVPSTLNVINTKTTTSNSPQLKPFPSVKENELQENMQADSNRIVSVYRTRVDSCNRLWFVDTGALEYPELNSFHQVQRPSLWAIDLKTNRRVIRYEIPESIVDRGTGMASVTIDSDPNACDQTFVYIPDLARARLYVYSLRDNRMWSFTHNYFHLDPLHGDFNIAGIDFQWDDGIFSITMGPKQPDGFRTVYFHPMVSTKEYAVSAKVLRNETAASRSFHGEDFKLVGDRGSRTQSTMHDYDELSGVMFFAEISKNGIGCWNTKRPLNPDNHHIIEQHPTQMIYPCDLQVDTEGMMWVLTNTMPRFLYSRLNTNEFNFRIWKDNALKSAEFC